MITTRSLPPAYTGIEDRIITAETDPNRTSTSYVERKLTVGIEVRNSLEHRHGHGLSCIFPAEATACEAQVLEVQIDEVLATRW